MAQRILSCGATDISKLGCSAHRVERGLSWAAFEQGGGMAAAAVPACLRERVSLMLTTHHMHTHHTRSQAVQAGGRVAGAHGGLLLQGAVKCMSIVGWECR